MTNRSLDGRRLYPKRCAALIFLWALSLLIMGALYRKAIPPRALIAAYPKEGAGSSIAGIEDANDSGAMLSCTRTSEIILSASGSNYKAIMVETNYAYPHVMQYATGPSGFFTKEDQEAGLPVAALNEAAAFHFFGGVDVAGLDVEIGGKNYTVKGVLYDGDKSNNNIYIPVDSSSQAGAVLWAAVDEGRGMGRETVLNHLKKAGITEESYRIADLERIQGVFEAKIKISLDWTAMLVLTVLGVWLWEKAGDSFAKLKKLGEEQYLLEMLAQNLKPVVKPYFYTALFIGAILAVIALFLKAYVHGLQWQAWQENIHAMAYSNPAYGGYHVISTVLMAVNLLCSLGLAAGQIKNKSRMKGAPSYAASNLNKPFQEVYRRK